jgi:ankyrin repeat protein
MRIIILELFLNWKGVDSYDHNDNISINHSDINGNSAIHYAATNGLVECVQRLIEAGAIISLGISLYLYPIYISYNDIINIIIS